MKAISETFSAADSPHLPSRDWGRGAGRDAGRSGGDGVGASHLSHGPCALQPWGSACWDRRCPDPPSGAQTPTQQWLFHITT